MSDVSEFDLAVVGGGLHGVSIAAEAASRGLSVVLLQGNDLASGPTGSIRSVLRGGLRKLEQLQLTTVNQNLYEIALLKTKAPHLLHLQKFHIHENTRLRSHARVQRGLKIYRYLQERQFKKANIREDFEFKNPGDTLVYYDYQLSNARLILAIATQAKQLGVSVRPREKVIAADRRQNAWHLEIEKQKDKTVYSLSANILVNCCGWLAASFLKDVLKVPTRCSAQTNHYAQLVVRKPKAFDDGQVFQLDDGKLLFAHSLDKEYFVLGPLFATENTERAKKIAIEEAMNIWNSQSQTLISRADIAYSCWTTRAKPEDPLSNDNGVFRESLLDLNNPGKQAPLLNLFGMNTVQHRLIAEQAVEILQVFTKAKKNPSFAQQALPGGNFAEGMEAFVNNYKAKLPTNLHKTLERLVASYGSLSAVILEKIVEGKQGTNFGHDLFEAEVRYLIEHEWAACAEDILWRRSYLGLCFSEEETTKLEAWIKANF